MSYVFNKTFWNFINFLLILSYRNLKNGRDWRQRKKKFKGKWNKILYFYINKKEDDDWNHNSDDEGVTKNQAKVKQVVNKNKNQGLNSLFSGTQNQQESSSKPVYQKYDGKKKQYNKDYKDNKDYKKERRDDNRPKFYNGQKFHEDKKGNFVELQQNRNKEKPIDNTNVNVNANLEQNKKEEKTTPIVEIERPNFIVGKEENKFVELDRKDVSTI